MKDPYAMYRYGTRLGAGQSDLGDIFAVHPIRRSLVAVLISLAAITLPTMLLEGPGQSAVLIITVWFGSTGLILCTPILIWSVLEALWQRCQRRLWPTIELLDLSPRARNLLRRHGFVTIASVERTPDATMLLLSNMDGRALREIRRSVSLWRYRRWQEHGFR